MLSCGICASWRQPCHCLRREKDNYGFVVSPWPMANPVNISKFEEGLSSIDMKMEARV